MVKKITFLLICFLYLKNAEAQEINNLLDSIRTVVNPILSDTSVSDACKKNIRVFKKAIPPKSKAIPEPNARKRLLRVTLAFTDSTNDAYKNICTDNRIGNLVVWANELTAELIKLNTDSVTIKLIDSSTKSGPNWALSIDSIGNATGSITIKDSLGYFKALLFPNTSYSVKAVTDKSNLNDSELEVGNNETGLLTIQVHKSKHFSENSNPDSFATELNKLVKENRLLLIAVSVLFFLILCGGIFFIRLYKNFKHALSITFDLSREFKKHISIMEETKNNPEIATAATQLKEEPPEPASVEKSEVVPGSTTTDMGSIAPLTTDAVSVAPSTTDPYFICEIMMTAGPRKKPMSDKEGDRDLGEDVCGFISNTNEVLLWLLDGTSDDDSWRNPVDKREYFSSRLLAQSIGGKLRKGFTEKRSESLVKLVEQAIDEVKVNWLEVIDKLPQEEKLYLKNKIENKNFPQCSTTILIGHLQKNGDFNAYRAGDSKMLLFSASSTKEVAQVETPLMTKNPERIFFSLQLNEHQKFKIVSNEKKARYEAIDKKNINTIISFSDGIGSETELLLKDDYENNPDKIKNAIIYHFQGTGDDKSICFIERKEMAT